MRGVGGEQVQEHVRLYDIMLTVCIYVHSEHASTLLSGAIGAGGGHRLLVAAQV